MKQQLIITYYHHSGFSVHDGDILLVFDYWRGEHNDVPEGKGITRETLRSFRKVIVFISHEHPDHMDPVVFSWRDEPNVSYVMSGDLPESADNLPLDFGRRLNPGDEYTIQSNLKVWTFGSTDLGVSFLVEFNGIMLFHAGDLNFWHWRDEATVAEIDQADQDFRRELEPLKGHEVDVAFFPVDPRQGQMYDAGANYFIMTVKPRLLIPMHFWRRGDLMQEFARRSRSSETEIIALTHLEEQMLVSMDESSIMNVTLALP